jgi:hypothetical protein
VSTRIVIAFTIIPPSWCSGGFWFDIANILLIAQVDRKSMKPEPSEVAHCRQFHQRGATVVQILLVFFDLKVCICRIDVIVVKVPADVENLVNKVKNNGCRSVSGVLLVYCESFIYTAYFVGLQK